MIDAVKYPAPKRKLWMTAGLTLALFVAATLRFSALSQRALWFDELVTLQRLSLAPTEHLHQLRHNHPLYEMLLRLWMPPSGSDAWMRIPSAALGVISAWMAYWMMRPVNRKTALVAAWLIALSPLHLMYSRIGRAYSLACVLAIASNLSLLWALRRRGVFPLAAYALSTTLMVYANLLAMSIWVSQVFFLIWHYRHRLGSLVRWVLATLAVAVLLAPWMIFNLSGAVEFGEKARYTPQQLGFLAKACYLPLTLCLGETVHPLNLWVVAPALIGFGVIMASAVIGVFRRRSRFGVFLLIQVFVLLSLGLLFPATAPKHLMVLLPAWCGLLAMGLLKFQIPRVRYCLAIVLLATLCASLFNYYTGRQFADADMVTPWREITERVKQNEQPGDALFIGYRPDRDVFDIFTRYYRGNLQPRYFWSSADWRSLLEQEIESHGRVLLLLHESDPWGELRNLLLTQKLTYACVAFQEEEHTLRGLREAGWRGLHKYRSPLYRLYFIQGVADRAADSQPSGT